MAAGTGKPLMRLKDLLELDCDSCSAAGFRCYPRRLGEASPTPLIRFRRSPPSSFRRASKLSHISRSLSRRLRGSFRWRRGNDHDEEEELDDAGAGARGCGQCGTDEPETSPSESSDSSGTTRRSESESESDFSSATSASENMHAAVATAGEEEGAMKKRRGAREEEGSSISASEADDKEQEQLSPVAVMGFPCFDDDCSPSSDDSALLRLQGGARKAHRTRRFGSLDELAPVGLKTCFAASLDDADDKDDVPVRQTTLPCPTSTSHRGGAGGRDEPDATDGFLVLLTHTVNVVSERLLLDFLVEMQVERRSERAGLPAPAGSRLQRKAERLEDDGEILAAARGWLLDGAGAQAWGLEDVLRGGEAVLAEMERGRRWMQVGEEEREVGTVVAGVLADQLVDEVVTDLLG